MKIGVLHSDDLAKVWEWISEDPTLHGDDNSPKSFFEFANYMAAQTETHFFAIHQGNKLVGAVGYEGDAKQLRGIVFSRAVRGTSFPRDAVRAILAFLNYGGTTHIKVSYYIHNTRIVKFLRRVIEPAQLVVLGVRNGAAVQNGAPVSMVDVIIPTSLENAKLPTDAKHDAGEVHNDPPASLLVLN